MYATKVSHFPASGGAAELDDGQPVAVHTVLIANSSAGVVDISFTQSTPAGDGTTVVGIITVPANDSLEWDPYAMFDKGFTVPAMAADVTCTVTWRPGV